MDKFSLEGFLKIAKTIKNIDQNYIDGILQTLKFYKGQSEINPIGDLTKRWYDSLESEPDYSVYADNKYLMEIWACWSIYSKRYINDIAKKMPMINESDSIVDLGCGAGLTTAYLKERFPSIRVSATQLKNNDQWNIAQIYSNEFGFELHETTKTIGESVIVYASEYFEHFEKPIEHLEEVLNDLNPNLLLISNSFNTIGLGHFKKYKHNNEVIDQKDISKRFNKKMREFGFKKLDEVKFWNNKPYAWIKDR